MSSKNTARVTVGLPPKLLALTQESAAANGRSVSAELVQRIQASFTAEEPDLLEITPWVPHIGQLVRTPTGAATITGFTEPTPGKVTATVWSPGHGPIPYALHLLRPFYTVNYAIRAAGPDKENGNG